MMEENVLVKSKTVAGLLRSKSRWTKRAWARTDSGLAVDSYHPKADCFCLEGAINRVYPTKSSQIKDRVTEYLLNHEPVYNSITQFNDSPLTTYTKVRKLVRALGI